MFDTTDYQNKPDLSKFGLRKAILIGPQILWNKGEDTIEVPSLERIKGIANSYAGKSDVLILDVEHWPLRGTLPEVRRSVEKYKSLFLNFKLGTTGNIVGFYGLPVGRDYWRAIGERGSASYHEWQSENNELKPIAFVVDASFPSLYAFYADQSAWVDYAVANIEEVRRLTPSKPVYAFIWPRFHESNKLLRGKDIPAEFWRLQLTTLRKFADGIVIWGGWKEQWNEHAEWWKVTKEFMETLN